MKAQLEIAASTLRVIDIASLIFPALQLSMHCGLWDEGKILGGYN